MADTILNGVCTVRMFIERPIPARAFIATSLLTSGTRLNLRLVGNAVLKATLRPHVSHGAVLTESDLAIMPSNAICRHSVACLSDGHETSSCRCVHMAAT